MQLSPAPPRLQASWLRSEHYGVPLERVEPTFSGAVDTGSLLYECGTQVLTALQHTLADEPVSLMVADRDGLVLARLCSDHTILRSLDAVHLAPGFHYSERDAGTNGLGLSLADRAPALVRADQHYCEALQGYSCAAAPVMDPVTGEVAGTVNLTTWADSSLDLLLALAQSAAGNTSALMLVRSSGRRPHPAPRGEVFRVVAPAAPGTEDPCTSRGWREALATARAALGTGRVVAVTGERGAGKRALVQLARQTATRRERLLNARPPAGDEIDAWLALWTPELREGTCVTVSDVDTLPAWAAGELAATLARARRTDGQPQPFVLTAADYASIPEPLAELVDTVVEVPPLRMRPDDVLPLAALFARQERRREVGFTPAASRALSAYHWPENVKQLRGIVREAAARAELVDARHLSPEVFSDGTRRLTRLETLERDEIVRCLTEPGATVVRAAGELGIGRATLYRKIAQYGIAMPKDVP
ncbi:MAG: GAF domain-containing protein [Motilibacteraceae bacterium]